MMLMIRIGCLDFMQNPFGIYVDVQ
jgi:hypothetical protein